MTEFQELTKDAPKFASMERGELVAYAYATYAAGAKMDAENAKLRELVRDLYGFIPADCIDYCKHATADNGCFKIGECWYDRRMRELGVME